MPMCSANTRVTSCRLEPTPVCGLVGLLGRAFSSGFMLTVCPSPLAELSIWVVDPYGHASVAICRTLWVSCRTQSPEEGTEERPWLRTGSVIDSWLSPWLFQQEITLHEELKLAKAFLFCK